MPYIDRDEQDRVIGIYAVRQYDGQEFSDDPVELTPAVPSALEQIKALEAENMMPRATREFMLTFMEQMAVQEGAKQGLTPEQSLAALRIGNSGYRKVKELDEQIDALRRSL